MTKAFGESSLGLSNHYYNGPDEARLRFVTYCEAQLADSASQGSISSTTFLQLLQKYCNFRAMRGDICKAAEISSFRTLPRDVQIAFVNERCDGPREARLVCLDYLMGESDSIEITQDWAYGICEATYPLLVSYDTTTATAGQHTFSTTALDEESPGATSEIVWSLQGHSIQDEGADSDSNVFDDHSFGGTSGSRSYQVPDALPSSAPPPKKAQKSKVGRATKSPSPSDDSSPSPSLIVTLSPSASRAEAPSDSPVVSAVPSRTPAPTSLTLAPTFSPSIFPSQVPSHAIDYNIDSLRDSSFAPWEPQVSSEPFTTLGFVGLLLAIMIVPLVFFLSVRTYYRSFESKKYYRHPYLNEDASVVSESSAMLGFMGSTFKKSDDISHFDIESNDSSELLSGPSRGFVLQFRDIFAGAYKFMDLADESRSEAGESEKPEPEPEREPEPEPEPVLVPERERQVFQADQRRSAKESQCHGRISAGTLLLPPDDMYMSEFSTSKDEYEDPLVMYQLETGSQSTRKGDASDAPPPTGEEIPQKNLSLPIPLLQNPKKVGKSGIRSDPVYSKSVPSFTDDSNVKSRAQSMNIDVLGRGAEKMIENELRIVGLASTEDSENQEDDQTAEVEHMTQESAAGMDPGTAAEMDKQMAAVISLADLRSALSPATYQLLSEELDSLMGGTSKQKTPVDRLVSPFDSSSSLDIASIDDGPSKIRTRISTPFASGDETPPSMISTMSSQSISRSSTESSWTSTSAMLKSSTSFQRGLQPTPKFPNYLSAGSWNDDVDGSSVSKSLSDAPSIASSQLEESGVEVCLTNGDVRLTTTTRGVRDMIDVFQA
jgi:hypothetical protein